MTTMVATAPRVRPTVRTDLTRYLVAIGAPALLLLAAIVIIGLPLSMAVVWSLVDPDHPWSYPQPFPTSLSLFQWQHVFRYSDIIPAIGTSYTLAPLSTLLTFLLALPTAYALGRHQFRGKEVIRILILLPIILPGMAVAMFLSRVFGFLGLSQTLHGLVIGHTLMGLPYMIRILATSFESIPQDVIDAAENLGASQWVKIKDIFIPMILPGIFAGSIFTFIASLEEFALTFVIGTPTYQTIPTILFGFMGYHFVRTNAAVVSLVLMVPNVILLFVVERFLKAEYVGAAYGTV
jgi:putative spermidine/putrescine transport system permease protein